jgi:hypothetical protein
MGFETVFKSNVKEAQAAINRVARERMLEAVQEVRNTTLETLSGSRSGRTYFVPGTKKQYTASAPGEPPASATGTLRKNVKSGVEGRGDSLTGFVGTREKYGPMLEYGTRRMAPRPWLRPSFEKSAGKLREIFTRIWFS